MTHKFKGPCVSDSLKNFLKGNADVKAHVTIMTDGSDRCEGSPVLVIVITGSRIAINGVVSVLMILILTDADAAVGRPDAIRRC